MKRSEEARGYAAALLVASFSEVEEASLERVENWSAAELVLEELEELRELLDADSASPPPPPPHAAVDLEFELEAAAVGAWEWFAKCGPPECGEVAEALLAALLALDAIPDELALLARRSRGEEIPE